ncbi:hypothetical protein Pmani_035953 [Petrolisthes manimaculis]|uniref:Transmembrane and TPR repeat-containing protein 3 n=1 Tax=Petrolisthes manimaculis TaxID=1843537 RepID=A0AAE1NJG9_9EUCA|nr:hypothetical protein Pmani_035953 [Petrolisthes manimaculis]
MTIRLPTTFTPRNATVIKIHPAITVMVIRTTNILPSATTTHKHLTNPLPPANNISRLPPGNTRTYNPKPPSTTIHKNPSSPQPSCSATSEKNTKPLPPTSKSTPPVTTINKHPTTTTSKLATITNITKHHTATTTTSRPTTTTTRVTTKHPATADINTTKPTKRTRQLPPLHHRLLLASPFTTTTVRMYVTLALVCVAVYVNGLTGEYVHDDLSAVVRNPDVQGKGPLWQVFLNDFWGKPMSHPASHKSYRPLTILSFR